MKLQIAGQATDVDNVLLRGTPCAAGFAIFHLKGDRIQCVEAINSPQDFLVGKQFISARTHIDPSKLSNPAIDRKSVVSGKSVSVRVDLGGRRIITKKTDLHTNQ